MTTWQTRHRGPYQFMVSRTVPPTKTGHKYGSEWLPGLSDSDEVEGDANALLADSRDTIVSVDVWSVHEGQFVMTYRNKGESK